MTDVEEMERRIAELCDQDRWLTRAGSVVVIDKAQRRAIRVLGSRPENSAQKAFEAMGWTWIDRAAGQDFNESV